MGRAGDVVWGGGAASPEVAPVLGGDVAIALAWRFGSPCGQAGIEGMDSPGSE